jgi:hypothetical protein
MSVRRRSPEEQAQDYRPILDNRVSSPPIRPGFGPGGKHRRRCLYRLPNRRPTPLGMWKERGAGAGWKDGIAGRGLLPKLRGALPPGWRLDGVA